MKKYIKYLLSDIEDLIEQAPSLLPDKRWHDDPEEEYLDIPSQYVTIADLVGMGPEVFPPEHFLTEQQVICLVEAISDLWMAWHLDWCLPHTVPSRTAYTSMVKVMGGKPISYNLLDGGEVTICSLNSDEPCQINGCEGGKYCKDLDDMRSHEISLWEDYMRSQGLDPDEDITPEEEALFEADMQDRRLSKEIDNNPFLYGLFTMKDQLDMLESLEAIDDLTAYFDEAMDEMDDEELGDTESPF